MTSATQTRTAEVVYPNASHPDTSHLDTLKIDTLTLRELVDLSSEIKRSSQLASAQRSELLETVRTLIWQRSVCDYDGY